MVVRVWPSKRNSWSRTNPSLRLTSFFSESVTTKKLIISLQCISSLADLLSWPELWQLFLYGSKISDLAFILLCHALCIANHHGYSYYWVYYYYFVVFEWGVHDHINFIMVYHYLVRITTLCMTLYSHHNNLIVVCCNHLFLQLLSLSLLYYTLSRFTFCNFFNAVSLLLELSYKKRETCKRKAEHKD